MLAVTCEYVCLNCYKCDLDKIIKIQLGWLKMEQYERSKSLPRQKGKPYIRPKLIDFGRIRVLTTGGSGATTETEAGNMSKNNRA